MMSSPEQIENPLVLSISTSPNSTGMIPVFHRAVSVSVLTKDGFPESEIITDHGGTETAGSPQEFSSFTTMRLSSRTSCWTCATAGI